MCALNIYSFHPSFLSTLVLIVESEVVWISQLHTLEHSAFNALQCTLVYILIHSQEHTYPNTCTNIDEKKTVASIVFFWTSAHFCNCCNRNIRTTTINQQSSTKNANNNNNNNKTHKPMCRCFLLSAVNSFAPFVMLAPSLTISFVHFYLFRLFQFLAFLWFSFSDSIFIFVASFRAMWCWWG